MIIVKKCSLAHFLPNQYTLLLIVCQVFFLTLFRIMMTKLATAQSLQSA
ncbi:hypothetical protein SeseC_01468 [Streptococcus equi subsp. zooepidemicus ATCC 35246]|nr:hypothetical protein SeseC_01468 [Streptococcus equi subsp. zooepidemicus ATCC 35246]